MNCIYSAKKITWQFEFVFLLIIFSSCGSLNELYDSAYVEEESVIDVIPDQTIIEGYYIYENYPYDSHDIMAIIKNKDFKYNVQRRLETSAQTLNCTQWIDTNEILLKYWLLVNNDGSVLAIKSHNKNFEKPDYCMTYELSKMLFETASEFEGLDYNIKISKYDRK